MASYNCLVIEPNGKKKRVKLNADTKESAQIKLKNDNKTILSIEEINDKGKNTFSRMKRFKKKDLSIFCRQLQAMLSAGLSISNCLTILGKQLDNKNLKIVVNDINLNIMKGNTFTEAIKFHENLFPDVFIHMVNAGELSGNLDGTMDRLADKFEKDYKLESKVKNALIYPVILSVLAISVVIFLLIFVLPTFMDIYTSSNTELPFITQMFINMSNFLREEWYIVIGILVAIYVARRLALQNHDILVKHDKRKMHMPITGKVNRQTPTALFARTMSTLLASGIALLDALDITSNVVGNAYISDSIMLVREEVRKGKSLSEPLSEIHVFPEMLSSMVKIGENSGTLEEILNKTADYYEMEVDNAVTKLTAVLEPIMIVVMAVIVGFIIIAMILPMFDMMNVIA